MLKQAVFRPTYLERRATRGTPHPGNHADAGPVSTPHAGSSQIPTARRPATTWWEEGWRLLKGKTGTLRGAGWWK